MMPSGSEQSRYVITSLYGYLRIPPYSGGRGLAAVTRGHEALLHQQQAVSVLLHMQQHVHAKFNLIQ